MNEGNKTLAVQKKVVVMMIENPPTETSGHENESWVDPEEEGRTLISEFDVRPGW